MTIALSEADALAPGAVVAKHYRIEEAIGRGGMGTVYRARDIALARDVAIKIHRAPNDHERLENEAFALARLAHPNVVTVYEIGTIDARRFVAMEYVRGGTARDWLAHRRGWREIVALFAAAGAGLAAAHRAGLVHRDFKPENVLVGPDGRPRVTDFGLVHEDGVAAPGGTPATADLTATGAVVGTPAYMAPEQLVGGTLDGRCDQFAFCVTLWEALYGERPFGGETTAAIQAAIAKHDLREVARRDVPARVREVLERGLAAAPGDRFADMTTLLAALRDAAHPRRARWIALAAVGVVAAGGAGWLVHAYRSQELADHCSRSAVAALWDAPQRVRIQASFLATGLPYAATTWSSASKAIDHFVTSWQAQDREDCVAYEIEDTESAAFHERRATCLERARIELEAVVDRLREVDRGHVAQTGRLVGALPDLAVCERAEALEAVDPGRRAKLSRYFAELAQVESLAHSGRYAEANKRAGGLVEIARGLDSRRDEAEAEYLAGQIAVELGDYKDGTRRFDRALATAEAAANDPLVAAIATDLVGLIGDKQARYADAQPYVGYARAAADRVGLVEPRAKALQVVGRVELLAGHFDEAERQLRRALELVEPVGSDTSRVASICTDLSRLASARGQPAQAEPLDRRALAIYTADLGAEHPATLTAANNLAATLAELGRYDEARAGYEHVLAVTERTLAPDSEDVAYALNNLASMAAQAGELARARGLLERSLAIFEKRLDPTHPAVAAVIENLGDIAVYEGRLDDAVRLQTRVLELRRRRLGSQHPDIAHSLVELADIAFEQRRIDAARELCDQARASIAASDANNAKLVVDIETCRGTAELESGRAANAVAILERANQIAAKADDMDPSAVASTRFALARALPPGAAARAIELARSARELFAHEGAFAKRQLAIVDTWLREHARNR